MDACAEAAAALDLECRRIGDVLAVCLPIVLMEGAPVYAFIRRKGDSIVITDDGDVRMSADAIGVGFRRRFDTTLEARIRDATEGLPIRAALVEGEIVAKGPAEAAGFVMDAFIRAVVAADAYIRERAMLGRREDEFIASLEEAVRRWFGEEPKRHARVRGASGVEHEFDLRAGRRLFDATHPNGRSTGPALRRALDVKKADESLMVVLVMDDEEDREAARKEAMIVSSVAHVIFRSDLGRDGPPESIAEAA